MGDEIMLDSIKKNIVQSRNQKELEIILAKEDFIQVNNKFPKKNNRVIFYLRRMLPHSGGYTSILRLGTELEKNGFKVFYAILSSQQNQKDAIKCATINLKKYKGKIIKADDISSDYDDIIIATYWKTVYQIKSYKGYKMYFVQDFEPYFTVFGEEYLLTLKTYELGFHIVSLGGWNESMIKKNAHINGKLDIIDFPFEPTEYVLKKRNYQHYKNKKNFTIAAFIKNDQKRIPNIIQNILTNLENEFKKNGYILKIKYFGINKKLKLKNGENLGILSKEELANLYENTDFGICGSMTNVSLVPYEMLAKGLPLIEFKEGTFQFFFPDNTAIITNFSYVDLYNKLIDVINNPSILELYQKNALDFLKNLSWEKTGKQFVNILKGCKNGRGQS